MTGPFLLTVTDVARLLGKAAVTVRGWERKGLIVYPRDSGGDRKFTVNDTRDVIEFSYRTGRINSYRYDIACATLTLLATVEKLNEDRIDRSPWFRQNRSS